MKKKDLRLFSLEIKKKKFFIISGVNSYFKSNFKKIFQRELAQIDKVIYFKKKNTFPK